MSRFLADENFPGAAVSALRAVGHDILWMRTDAPGTADREIVARAMLEARVILSFDKDFGELAFHSGLGAGCGVVLFRVPMSPPGSAIARIVTIIQSRDDWVDNFSVVETHRIRMRPLAERDLGP